jgi:hypothetical protein
LNRGRPAPIDNNLKIHHKNMTQFVARLLHRYISRYEPLRSPLPPLNQSSYTNFSFHDWPSLPHPASYFFVAVTSGTSRFPKRRHRHGVRSNRELPISPAALNLPPVISGGHPVFPGQAVFCPWDGHPVITSTIFLHIRRKGQPGSRLDRPQRLKTPRTICIGK